MNSNNDVVAEYFRCVNDEDWTAFAELWTDDAELIALGARPRNGKEDVLGYYAKIFTPWREHYDEATRVLVADSAITVEVHFSGVTGDGTPVEFDAIDLFDFVDGEISRLSNWYDVMAARKAIGMT
ncbi:MAG: nuclear transport factor 2 family protein [Acidimicrobiia bacterium]|nr:nuclear transport factor 2 family protein [Acidimicrobiia bacterium]